MLKKVILFFSLSISLHISGQDFQFAQFYALPLYYNPAFAGANLNSRLTAGYRNQWAGLQGWRGWVGSFDWHLKEASSGIGLLLTNNSIDRLGYGQTTGMLQYAYRAKISEKIRVSSGLGIGFGQVSWSFGNQLFGDELAGDPVLSKSQDPIANNSLSDAYFDLQLGMLVYSQKWWTSLSVLHPHSPKFNLIGDNLIDPKINLSAGYRFEMKKPTDYKGEISPNAITPAILLRSQGAANQLDLGVYVHYVPFVFGVWYRGIPSPVKGTKTLNHDAITALVGIKQNNLSIGYSYDINVSGLVGVLGGSHEITVTYEFKTKYLSLKGLKQGRALPCPSF
jgi:type IX secretion system PorP/SprF family membrane protein